LTPVSSRPSLFEAREKEVIKEEMIIENEGASSRGQRHRRSMPAEGNQGMKRKEKNERNYR